MGESSTFWDNKILIGISGPMGAGKTTLAKDLCNNLDFTRFSFAGPVRQEVADGMGIDLQTLMTLEDVKGKSQFRQIYQAWGNGMRTIRRPDYWINKLFDHIESGEAQMEANEAVNIVVIDDVRYPNEVQAIKDRGGMMIHLEISTNEQLRRGMEPQFLEHPSESALYQEWGFQPEADFSTGHWALHDLIIHAEYMGRGQVFETVMHFFHRQDICQYYFEGTAAWGDWEP